VIHPVKDRDAEAADMVVKLFPVLAKTLRLDPVELFLECCTVDDSFLAEGFELDRRAHV
jgi:hypothetical protein